MLTALLGRKVGMTQVFTDRGNAIPVTVVEAGPCVVTQLRTLARDGYEAVQIGYGTAKMKNTSRAELGHLGHALPTTDWQRKRQQTERAKARQEARAKNEQAAPGDETNLETEAEEAESQTTGLGRSTQGQARAKRRAKAGSGLGPFALLREVEAQAGTEVTVGQTVDASMFALGEFVDVIGTSKGKGFAGVMKRHGFHGGQRTHGQSDRERAPGSIGAGTTPGRVLKGTRMAGHMGHVRRTVQKLEIVQADAERNLLVIKGSIPGPNGGVVLIRKMVEM